MSRCLRTVSVAALLVFIFIMPMAAWAQSAPADSSPAPASTESTVPAQSASPNLPSNYRVVPNAKDGNVSSGSLHPKVVERWDTPSLEGSQLGGVGAIQLGDTDKLDTYTREVQRVMWRVGDPIDLYIIRPVGVKKPPVILYLYSFPFETDRFSNANFCRFLVRNGVAAVGFPSALTAARYHDRGMKEWFASQMDESLATSAHDVQKIIDYLDRRADFDMNRVGMFGDGSGATIAILAASVDPRIKSLDLIDPWGDWPDWAAKSTRIPENERPNFVKPEWLKYAGPLDPVKWLPKLKTPNVRIQFVKSVTVTPLKAQKKIEAAAPPQAQIVHYEDATAFQTVAATGKGFDWIKERVLSSGPLALNAAGAAKTMDSKSESPR